jgi:hypothetical protein
LEPVMAMVKKLLLLAAVVVVAPSSFYCPNSWSLL